MNRIRTRYRRGSLAVIAAGADAVPGCGHRETCWSSTGARSGRCCVLRGLRVEPVAVRVLRRQPPGRGSSINVAIRRDANSCGGPSSVEYATVDGSAKAGSDYTAVSGTATFEMGPDPGGPTDLRRPVMKDSEAEGGETFKVVRRMNAGQRGDLLARAAGHRHHTRPAPSPRRRLRPPPRPAYSARNCPAPARSATTTRLSPSTTVVRSTSTSSSTPSTSTTSTTTLGSDEIAAAPTSSEGRGLPAGL